MSQTLFPQEGLPQSPGHDTLVSPLLQMASPQKGVGAQSAGQVHWLSPLLQRPSPQKGTEAQSSGHVELLSP